MGPQNDGFSSSAVDVDSDAPSTSKNDTARTRFESGVASMREGTKLYLTNDFRSAESLFQRGTVTEYDGSGDNETGGGGTGETKAKNKISDTNGDKDTETDTDAEIDLRGAFALQYAIVGLLRGVASMEDDQLDTSLSRLWEADAMAALDAPWVGRKVVRGLCQLMAGIVECLRKSPAKGAYHMAGSWVYLRALRTEALDYDGMGREVVRSSALLGLGAFALILSLLPDKLVRAASWTTGFEVDRAAGLEMLQTCQREGGVYAPIAALGWISFTVDTKTFLGEEQTDEELAECETLLEWAKASFPDSLFFGILEADLHASRRRLPEALGVLEHAMALPCLDELRALKAVFSYKKAIYHLAALEWIEAARAFELAQAIYKASGRRSLGPSMAMYAAQCFCIDGGDGCEEAVARMMGEVATYKELDKSNWPRPDNMMFQLHGEYADGSVDNLPGWSLLHIATTMAITMRCTLWMNSDVAGRFVALLDGAGYDKDPDDAARAVVCIAQLHTHQGSIDTGLARCTKGLDLAPLLGESSRKFGTLPMLHYLAAHLHCAAGALHRAEVCLGSSVGTTDGDMDLQHYLSFKTSQLGRIVKKRLEDTYVRLALPAGKKAMLTIDLSSRPTAATGDDANDDEDTNTFSVRWDWSLEGRDVDFYARFLPRATTPVVEGEQEQLPLDIVPKTRHSAGNGPVEGAFCLPDGCEGGVLELLFSNQHSYLRGKVVTYKLVLPPNTTASDCEVV